MMTQLVYLLLLCAVVWLVADVILKNKKGEKSAIEKLIRGFFPS